MKRFSVAIRLVLFCSSLLIAGAAVAQTIYEDYTVTTLAGPDEGGPGWKDGLTNVARFGTPAAVAQDGAGNIFVADPMNHTIRKITPAGVVMTVAGSTGFSGTNDGVGNDARFNTPYGIAVDTNGNLFVADTGNSTIRKITPDGTVTTFAGAPRVTGATNGAASAARFFTPYGVMVDRSNTVYVADTFNDTIRVITPAGVVSTLAGKAGVVGSADKTGTAATFNKPVSLAMDSAGNIYVADTANHSIRKIAAGAVVTTLAGSNGVSGSADGTNSTARFNTPYGITVDASDNIYVADTFNSTLRKVTLAGVVTTPLGVAGAAGAVNGSGNQARLSSSTGVTAGNGADVIIADFSNSSVRKAIGGTNLITISGPLSGTGTQNGPANTARFSSPAGTAVDAAGNVYVADEQNNAIRKITPLGDVSTFAGTMGVAGSNDASGLSATFNHPLGVAFDPGGNLFVADSHNHTIRKITPGGDVSTFAGLAGVNGTNDGVGTNALFNSPFGITVDAQTNVYVADTFNHSIRKITPGGTVSTLAGVAGVIGTNNGTGVGAKFAFPEGIAVDPDGNVFVADDDDFTIRKITPAGVVTTFAGVPGVTGSSDGTDAARFNFPFGLAIDANRNLYLNDTANHIIRKITPAGAVTTLAGVAGVSGNVDGTGSDARFGRPAGIAVDGAGNLYISDEDAHVIRKAYPAPSDMPTVDIASGHTGVTRHFGIANETTTTWSWTLIRVPATSSAQISAATSATPTFTPDVEDSYLVRFQGWDNSGRTVIRMLKIDARNTALLTVLLHGGGKVNPDLNGQRLQLGQTYTITAQAGANCSFINWTGSTNSTEPELTFVMETNLTFTANFTDPIAPTLTITSPKSSLHVSNANFIATGTAADNGQVAAVWYQLNGGTWLQATNTTNWTAGLTLTQSNNTLQAYSVDSLGNISTTNSVAFIWVPSSQITLLAVGGQGTFTPAYNGTFLQNGKAFKVTAKPGFNNFFLKWTDNLGNTLSTSPNFSFTAQSNATYYAFFVANPFAPLSGPFDGLFFNTNNIAATNSGHVTLSLTGQGGFSAKGQFTSGQKLSVSGKFAPDGTYSNTISAKGSAPLTVQLQLSSVNAGQVTGTISGAGWTSPLLAVRALYSPANPAPQRANYTLVIPGGDDSTTQPAGNGYGTVSVDVSGNIVLKGLLGDGAIAAQKTFINKPGVWPLFIAPYKGGSGAIFGWMSFANLNDSDVSGRLYWLKGPQSKATSYGGGFSFTEGIRAVGSLYSFTNGTPLLNLPAGGISVLQLGNPVQSFTNNFTLGNDNTITSANGLAVTITTSTGMFKGTAVSLGDGSTVPITGVLLQKQNAAFGYFLKNGQTGGVYLGQ